MAAAGQHGRHRPGQMIDPLLAGGYLSNWSLVRHIGYRALDCGDTSDTHRPSPYLAYRKIAEKIAGGRDKRNL